MADSRPVLPEAVLGLLALLRYVPSADRDVLLFYSRDLQRSGCIHCGFWPHGVFDCQLVPSDKAEIVSGELEKQVSHPSNKKQQEQP